METVQALGDTFHPQKGHNEEGVLLKLLQTILAILTCLTAGPHLAGALATCFALYGSKNANVQITATFTINKVTTLLFDRLALSEEIAGQETAMVGSVEEASDVMKCAYFYTRDLCLLAEGAPTHWLRNVAVQRTFVLDLLYSILTAHPEVFSRAPLFTQLIHEKLTQGLTRSVATLEIPVLIRMQKIVGALLQRLGTLGFSEQTELCFNMQRVEVENRDVPIPRKIIVLSVWKDWCKDANSLLGYFKHFDQQEGRTNVFQQIVQATCACLRLNYVDPVPTLSTERLRQLHVDHLQEDLILSCRPADVVLLCLDVLCNTVAQISVMHPSSSKRKVEVEAEHLKPVRRNSRTDTQTSTLVQKMCDSIGTTLLKTIQLLLVKATEDDVLAKVLQCYMQIACSCGKVGLEKHRDAFIESLCQQAFSGTQLLSWKDVQILKVIFNITNVLGGNLGASWRVVLPKLQQLDVCLNNPQTLAQEECPTPREASTSPLVRSPTTGSPGDELSLSASSSNLRTERKLLGSLLDNLFEHGSHIEEKSLIPVLHALIDQSTEDFRIESMDSRKRMFAFTRLVALAITNVGQLSQFINILQLYFLAVGTNTAYPPARKITVESVEKLIRNFLQIQRDIPTQPSEEEIPALIEYSANQKRLFGIFEALFEQCTCSEVRAATLGSLHNLVQLAGQQFTTEAWYITLAVLQKATQAKTEVPVGAALIKFICNDFLAQLDEDRILELITVVGAYMQCAVDEKVNVNLSAIELLWAISDHCSHRPIVSAQHWNSLFVQLRDTAFDQRAEVRHSALKTLFQTILTHGGAMPAECWPICVWDVLVKILDRVQEQACRLELAERSNDSQVSSPLRVHHSRNSSGKQWQETWRTALAGAVRVIRAFYGFLYKSLGESFVEAVLKVITHLNLSAQHTVEEISLEGVRGIQSLLTEIPPLECPVAVWETAWDTWKGLAQACLVESHIKPKVVLVAVETISEIYAKNAAAGVEAVQRNFSITRVAELMHFLHDILRSPVAVDTFIHPSKLQLGVLQCIENLAPFAADELWLAVVRQLCSYLPDEQMMQTCLSVDDTSAEALLVSSSLHVDFCCKVLVTVEKVFEAAGTVSPTLHLQMLLVVLRMFRSALLTRFVGAGNFSLWKAAVPAFRKTVKAFFPTLSVTPTMPELDSFWAELHSSLSQFLLQTKVDDAATPRNASAEPSSGESEELQLIEMIRDDVLPQCDAETVPDTVVKGFLGIIERCAKNRRKRRLAKASVNTLFYLCQRVVKDDLTPNYRVGVLTLPVLVRRCQDALLGHILEDRDGKDIPQYRVEETVHVLEELSALQVEPQLLDNVELPPLTFLHNGSVQTLGAGTPPSVPAQNPHVTAPSPTVAKRGPTNLTPVASTATDDSADLRISCPAAYRKRGILVRLLPLLVEFVSLRRCEGNDPIPKMISEILRIAITEIGLPALAIPIAHRSEPAL
eukprot:TRINITY_DN20356_c0_g1_i1.p1 TRINITY_DN20356_c0_g1~~TRINITY_DN20356_c0_g1_i1.p1  ORF type:complete len:1568 (+),score=267.02 TRINITY_DN20356_c0_g1_i1:326-4705(+)